MVHSSNKNNCINALQRVTKMLKPLLRRLSKRSRVAAAVPQEQFTSDFCAENAANEALEARLQLAASTLPTHGAMTVVITPQWYHAAPDRDILCSLSSSCSQTPEQQSPAPKSIQHHEQEWW